MVIFPSVQDLPQVTDRSFNSLYEAVFSWGKRRNMETAGLRDVQIRDIPLITRQVRSTHLTLFMFVNKSVCLYLSR